MGQSSSSVPPSGPEVDFIKNQINSNCVVVFSKSTCPHCKATKKLFEELGVNASVIELDSRTDGSQLQDILESMTGARTVPRVFINGESIGGNSEVQALHKAGNLEPKIKNCSS